MRAPPRLNISNGLTSWLDRLWRRVVADTIIPGPGYRVTRTPDGTRLNITPGGAGGGGGTYHEFKLCRNGQQITVNINSEEDPATIPDP